MGLFSDIANVFEAPGKRKAASSAAAWQQAGLTDYINKISGVQATNDADYAPYVASGQNAVGAEGDLAGINGNDAQAASIANLQNSPLYQSLYRTGQNAVLANAAATGGLRGGNVQTSLANFGQNTLASVIQNQLATLGGLSSQGLNATNTITAQDNNTANTVGNLLSGIAQSKGGLALAKNTIDNQQYGSIASVLGDVVGAVTGVPGLGGSGSGSDISSLISSLLGGGSVPGSTYSSGLGSATAGTVASNPFDSGDFSGDLGNLSRSQGGGVGAGLSSALQGLYF